ncbi:MAG: carboxypeptidase-like regulatory domain-containing protein, partial [Planctomycetota bacterium]
MAETLPPKWLQLQVTVRDRAVGQPVPFFDLEAQSGDSTQQLRTDSAGVVELKVPKGQPVEFYWGTGVRLDRLSAAQQEFASKLPEDLLRQYAESQEAKRPSVSHRWEGESSGAVELLASVGPTWFVDVQTRPGVAPPLLSGLKAKLRYAESLLSPVPEQALAYNDVLWVRFPELPVWKTQEGQDLQLILQDEAGLFQGAATVSRMSGFTPHPLPVLLEQCSAFVGTVSDDSGTVVQGVTVRAQAPGEERTLRTGSKADGRYRIQSLEPKLWTLYVSDPRFELFERAVTLRPGVEEVQDISLVRKRGGGRVAGTITSQSGTFEGWVFFFLEGLDGTTFWR